MPIVKGMFFGWDIQRFRCLNCDVIWGPERMLDIDIGPMYVKLYSQYSEGDTRETEKVTFRRLKPKLEGRYLNYGAGKRNIEVPPYTIIPYEPYAKNAEAIIELKPNDFYDGIFSHNTIEHFQDPISALMDMKLHLKPDGMMAHSTDCYEYKIEGSEFHLFFLLGRSIDYLAKALNMTIVERPGYWLVLSQNPTST